MTTRRSVADQHRIAWLLRAITCIDLTTLGGDDTPDHVRRLCAQARRPVPQETLAHWGAKDMHITVAAVCVYPRMVPIAIEALAGTDIPVASVATGFPDGQIPHASRLEEIRAAVEAGATEIDIVISRAHAITGRWKALYDEVRDFREACGQAHMKTILATGQLPTLRHVAMASRVCMMAGADFIKTSTGKEKVNATLPVGLVMARAIRDYYARTGHRVGLKPAGGIRTPAEAIQWLILTKETLGDAWTRPERFRIGASSLLDNVVDELTA